MRTGTIILAVLLAGGLAVTANAADVTISLELDSQTVDPGEFVNFTIFAEVTNNHFDFGWGDSYIFDGGLASFYFDMQFSQPGKLKVEEGKGPPPHFLPNGKPKVSINAGVFSGLQQSPSYGPNEGLNNAAAGQPLLPADRWENPWPARYSIGNGDVGTRVELMSGRIQGVASGAVDITIGDVVPSTMYIYILDELIGINTFDIVLATLPPGEGPVPPQDHHLLMPGNGLDPVTLIVTGVGGNAPSASIGASYGPDDWVGPPPWNEDARQITVTGTGEDNDGDTQQLTFEWMVADHAGTRYGPLVDEGVPPPGEQSTITFSIGQLRNLGFPLPDPLGGNPDQYVYDLILTVTDVDGSAEATTGIYIPEPGTMALLGLGALALIRRRRQA